MTLTCALLLGLTVVATAGFPTSTPSPTVSSDKPADKSERGGVQRIKGRTLSMRIGGRSRDMIMDDKTVLLDREGAVRARGPKAIAPLVPIGTDVIVTWAPFWVTDGAGQVTSYYRRAIEIRVSSTAPPAAEGQR